ncbi:MAG: hypothetical protein ACYCW6_25795 [Candidatus Xenobia bacterium]
MRTWEMRWFFPGEAPAAVRAWLGQSPVREARVDVYLVAEGNDGVGLKLRGQALELKLRTDAIRGEGPHWSGLAECWLKWRWPYAGVDPAEAFGRGGSVLVTIEKERAQRYNEGPFAIELTELRSSGQPWWTVGFDVFDRPGEDGRALLLSHVSRHVAQYPGPPLQLALSRGYPAWLASL